jgi:hypothetical protein
MSPRNGELKKENFSKIGRYYYLVIPTPLPRSNKLKDLEAVGRQVFEE